MSTNDIQHVVYIKQFFALRLTPIVQCTYEQMDHPNKHTA